MKGPIEARALGILAAYLSPITARAVFSLSVTRAGVSLDRPQSGDGARLLQEIERAIGLYVRDPLGRRVCCRRLADVFECINERHSDPLERVEIAIRDEADIVTARTAGRDLCQRLGFSPTVQIKLATVVSELARNIVQYASTGLIAIAPITTGRVGIEVVASDQGPGIPDLEVILAGKYRSASGLGMGLLGTRRLVDEFDVKTAPDRGTRVRAVKFLT